MQRKIDHVMYFESSRKRVSHKQKNIIHCNETCQWYAPHHRVRSTRRKGYRTNQPAHPGRLEWQKGRAEGPERNERMEKSESNSSSPKTIPTPQKKNVPIRWAHIPNKMYRSCREAGALGEKTFQRYRLQSEETNTERPLVQFSHRLYLMLNSVLVVAISIAPPAQRSPTSGAYSGHLAAAMSSFNFRWVCSERSLVTNFRCHDQSSRTSDWRSSSNSKGEQSLLFPVSCPVTVHETPIPLKVLITQIGTLARI